MAMTKEEMFKQIAQAKVDYIGAIGQIQARFATDHNPYKVGDILEDPTDNVRIKVESMEYTVSFQTKIPYAVYNGTRLNKSNIAFKNKEKATLYQCNNLIKIEN